MRFDRSGNCYEAAYRVLMTKDKNALYVQGMIHSTKLNRDIFHCWVESKGKVYDFAGGRKEVVDIGDYYRYGRARAIRVYARWEAQKMAETLRNFHFWTDEERSKILGDTTE